MDQKDNQSPKTIVNVGFCETSSEWLERIISELADESRNKVSFDMICN